MVRYDRSNTVIPGPFPRENNSHSGMGMNLEKEHKRTLHLTERDRFCCSNDTGARATRIFHLNLLPPPFPSPPSVCPPP